MTTQELVSLFLLLGAALVVISAALLLWVIILTLRLNEFLRLSGRPFRPRDPAGRPLHERF